MMNMISFSTPNSFDKQIFSPSESTDDSKTEDFAAIFSAPINIPQIEAPVKISKPEDSCETKAEIQSIQNLPETDSQIEPIFLPKAEAQKPEFIKIEGETLPESKFTETVSPAESQPQTNFAGEIPNRILPTKTDFGLQIFATHRKITDVEVTSSLRRKFVPPLSQQNFLAQIQTVSREISKSFEQLNQTPTSNIVPKLFVEISKEIKSAKPIEANSKLDLATEQKSVEQIKQNFSGEMEQNLSQPETEQPKSENDLKVLENFTGQTFDKFFNFVSKEQTIGEKILQTDDLKQKVFEQIEPRIVEIAALNPQIGEKRVLKMRLNPAELGAVEITIEKTSSGKISAHFHTESDSTKQILTENLDNLRGALQNSGLQIGNLEISSNSSDSSGQKENQSRQFYENSTDSATNFDGNSDKKDEVKEINPNRLVNLRA
jgi:flagellar hook-length control protein FliK